MISSLNTNQTYVNNCKHSDLYKLNYLNFVAYPAWSTSLPHVPAWNHVRNFLSDLAKRELTSPSLPLPRTAKASRRTLAVLRRRPAQLIHGFFSSSANGGIFQEVFWLEHQLFSWAYNVSDMGVGQNLLLSILMGWTSIYQLFWGSLDARVLINSHMCDFKPGSLHCVYCQIFFGLLQDVLPTRFWDSNKPWEFLTCWNMIFLVNFHGFPVKSKKKVVLPTFH